LSNAEQRDGWLNSGYRTLAADRCIHEIKVTHKKAQDFSIGLGLAMCISSIRNLTGTLLSSPCQMLIKEQLA